MNPTTIVVAVLPIILINNVEGKFDIEGMKKMAKPLKMPCIEQSGISIESVTAANQGDFSDPTLGCYFKCILQKLRVIQNGRIQTNNMRTQTKAMMVDSLVPRALHMIDVCEHKADNDDECEASLEYIKCCFELDSAMNFFPD